MALYLESVSLTCWIEELILVDQVIGGSCSILALDRRVVVGNTVEKVGSWELNTSDLYCLTVPCSYFRLIYFTSYDKNFYNLDSSSICLALRYVKIPRLILKRVCVAWGPPFFFLFFFNLILFCLKPVTAAIVCP